MGDVPHLDGKKNRTKGCQKKKSPQGVGGGGGGILLIIPVIDSRGSNERAEIKAERRCERGLRGEKRGKIESYPYYGERVQGGGRNKGGQSRLKVRAESLQARNNNN